MKLILFLIVFIFTACAGQSTGILKMGPDTYSVSISPSTPFEANAMETANIMANQYCASLGKEILVSNTSLSSYNGTAKITFYCLSENDPDLIRPSYESAPDIVIENR